MECGGPCCTLHAFAAASARSSSGRSALFVATTAAKCNKLQRSGIKEGLGGIDPPPCLTDPDEISLLRSFYGAACETLSMNLSVKRPPLPDPLLPRRFPRRRGRRRRRALGSWSQCEPKKVWKLQTWRSQGSFSRRWRLSYCVKDACKVQSAAAHFKVSPGRTLYRKREATICCRNDRTRGDSAPRFVVRVNR